MIADDEPDCLFAYHSFLEKEGFIIHGFSDPKLALKYFVQQYDPISESKFDLVLLDIRMPHLNGLQLYCRLKAIDPHVRILFGYALCW
jgi:DNA-binding response OmpR family regulator